MRAATLSLFASRKLIDLRLPTGKPGKDGSAAIVAYCESPPPDTVLLITTNDWSKQHEGAWVKAIEQAGVFVPVWPLKREELPDWIGARMASRGVAATPDAIAWLADRVEGNLLAAAQEIDKLALLGERPRARCRRARSAASPTMRATTHSASPMRRSAATARRALRIVAGLRAEGEELIPLLGWVLNQLRVLLRLSARPNLAARSATERTAGARRLYPSRAEERRTTRIGSAASRRPRASICIAKGQQLDAAGKSWGDGWRELERLIAAIAKPRAAAELLA